MTPADRAATPTALPPRTSRTADEELVGRLQWLMMLRVGLITVLLGTTLLVRADGSDPVTNSRHLTLLVLIIATYGLTILYAVLLKRLQRGLVVFSYAQLLIDLGISTVLAAVTGGTESVFLFMFTLVVLVAAILLYRRGALYLSAAATGCLVLLVARDALGWWHPTPPPEGDALRAVFLSGLTNISAVFFVGLLSGYLSEQLRDAGQRLRFASEDLEALRALNDHIITSIQSGLVSFTLDHRVIFFNPAAARITGLETDDVLYADVLALFPFLAARLGGDEQERWEETFAHPSGGERTIGCSLSPLLDGLGEHQGWILIFQDLTPLRALEDSMRRSERFAVIGKMAAGIAHEIRNPLASMSGSIQMLARSAQEPMQERLMRIVLREIDRLNALITDFLQFARPNPPQFDRVELATLFDDLAGMFANQPADRPPVELIIEHDEALTISADAGQLKQVFWNLINNGAQAMAEGGRLEIRCRRMDATRAIVTVTDHGAGIPDEVQPRIFDPFFSTKDHGTGLGLAQAHRIIDEHGGFLSVRSTVDVGSTFTVVLPFEQPVAAAGAAPDRLEAAS
ncbi:MAG: PAS domain-containing protein [Myxococcales bacterium]|nr:PAS domain-containing protein [Myxococcales bacterium]